jgi:quercetin dioxygenase-like cupin family protein
MPLVHRYITTHNHDGEAVFLSASQVPDCAPNRPAGDDGEVALLFATDTFPVKLEEEADVAVYDSYLHTPPGLTPEHGTVMRVVDMQPRKETPMHRTTTLDYGVVLEGEVELILDSGQSRVMRRGDVSIQRATAHSYRNRSETDWCRLLFVFLPIQPVTVAGKELKEEWYDEDEERKGQEGESTGIVAKEEQKKKTDHKAEEEQYGEKVGGKQ